MTYEEKLKKLKTKNSEISRIQNEVVKLSSSIFDDFRNYIFDK